MRICSMLPSATEMLFAIAAGSEVVAVTFECDYPSEARSLPQVVGSRMPPALKPSDIDALVRESGARGESLYFADFDRIEELAPDLVILQDLCRVCAIDSPTLARDVSRISSKPRVLSLSAGSLEGVFLDIEELGRATGHLDAACRLAEQLRGRVDGVRAARHREPRPRVLCLEWLDPLFQGGHWIPEMVQIAGGDPVLATPFEKSVRISWEQVAEAQPEIVVVMPCGFHLADTVVQFRQAEAGFPPSWRTLPAVVKGQVFAADGSAYFSRPGPRLAHGLEILHAVISNNRWENLPPESVARLDCR